MLKATRGEKRPIMYRKTKTSHQELCKQKVNGVILLSTRKQTNL